MQIKIALPKGRLLDETATLLQRGDWGLSEYSEGMRSYRLTTQRFPNLLVKVFHEKDIPIQVAVGNYDLGICGLDWVEELLTKYPSASLVKVRNLGYGESSLYMVASKCGTLTPKEMQAETGIIRIASEYPNLAESFALNLRLRRFSIFPLWGAAQAYPPENADLALISVMSTKETANFDLLPISNVLNASACLVANKSSWERQDLSEILETINNKTKRVPKRPSLTDAAGIPETAGQHPPTKVAEDIVRLALPDGHQQGHTLKLLNKAGIQIDDYPSATGNRRPTTNLDKVMVKVIRPQDMPMQVSNGNFDLAITGKDWLREHLYQFPSSPVTELLDLKIGKVKIVAVVSQDLAVSDASALRQLNAERPAPFRVASEYVNIADKFARDNHIGMYRVIPTWGATEAFIPEDADLLIENTETGRTIARHNLKIIDTLFESTACLIGNKNSLSSPGKRERIESLMATLRTAVEES